MRKRKNCATGGGLDPWTLLASQGTQMIGDFGSAINYKPQLGPEKSQGDYNKDIITKGIMQGPLGAIPSIIRMMKDKNTIVSGSPGTYQQGGPIQTTPIQRPLQQNIVRTRPIQQSTDVLNSFNPFYTPTATGVPTLSAMNMFDYGHPSKSKSKDRFRERATGGPIDPNKPLQFLGRSYTNPPESWKVPKNPDAGQMDVRQNVIPKNRLNLKGIYTQATDKTPYMHINDNIYYNPYDEVYTARQKDGSYKEIPETATIDSNKGMIKNYQGQEIDNPFFDLGESYRLRGKGDAVPRHLEKYPKQNRATGGSMDQQLSSSAFQVKGNANQTDGNHYPEYNANLDHNEVVDQNAKFVFSDDLKLPGTKRSFAQAVKPLYKKVGDLETRKDPISLVTKEQIGKQINSLAMSQEQLATMMGLRDEQSTNVATGGPLPWEGFDVAEFQAWYNSMPGGSKVGMDGKWGPATKKAYEAVAFDYMKAKGKNTVNSIGSMSTVLPDGSNYVDVQPTDGKLLPSSIGEPQKLPQIYDTANLPNRSGYSFKPTRTADGSMITSLDTNDMLATLIPNNGVDPILAPQASDIAGGMKALGTKYSPANIANSRNDFNQGFTAGDIMQGIEVGSKFFNVFEGAEQEGQILNNTPITKTGYDVNPALYQNQRNYRNTLNGIGTASAPQRRALSNQLLATKLNADNQVLSNYQNMNNEATVNYENRLSQQRQGNIASEFRTDDLNAANRGLYDQAQQNAFTSVGNFGEALNRRKMSQDALQLLRINYPDIYESVMGDLNTVKKRTSTQVKIG